MGIQVLYIFNGGIVHFMCFEIFVRWPQFLEEVTYVIKTYGELVFSALSNDYNIINWFRLYFYEMMIFNIYLSSWVYFFLFVLINAIAIRSCITYNYEQNKKLRNLIYKLFRLACCSKYTTNLAKYFWIYSLFTYLHAQRPQIQR